MTAGCSLLAECVRAEKPTYRSCVSVAVQRLQRVSFMYHMHTHTHTHMRARERERRFSSVCLFVCLCSSTSSPPLPAPDCWHRRGRPSRLHVLLHARPLAERDAAETGPDVPCSWRGRCANQSTTSGEH